MANEGVNRLARILQGRIQTLGEIPSLLDIGEIQSDLSLKTNQFPMPIPQSDYLVCRSVALGKDEDILSTTKSGEHIHNVLVGDKLRGLQSGDRVLVVWLGNDPCVIDLILPATVIE